MFQAVLAYNNCDSVFWIGNLKNRDLQGNEIQSQADTTVVEVNRPFSKFKLAVLDRARRGYLGFLLSKKRLVRGKQTFYFKLARDKKSSFECVFQSRRAQSKTAKCRQIEQAPNLKMFKLLYKIFT